MKQTGTISPTKSGGLAADQREQQLFSPAMATSSLAIEPSPLFPAQNSRRPRTPPHLHFSCPPLVHNNHNLLLLRAEVPARKPRRAAMWRVMSARADAGAVEEKTMPPEDRMLVFVPPHPLIKHWIAVLRNEETPCPIFRSAMGELGRILIYEASRDWLPTISGEIQTPMGTAAVEFIDPREPVMVIPILRAGLALVEHASSILPSTKTYHLGLRRDEETLQPSIYLNNLPDKFPTGCHILLVDPMLATGGTMVAAVDLLKDRGVQNRQIRIISAVAAPPALQKLSKKFPGIHVYTGMIDAEVNDKGFIIPGLGDAGDRSFGT